MEKNLKNNLSAEYECVMIGGDGPLSYAKNSSYQRSAGDSAELLIREAVANKLAITNFSNKTFCIADLGCSTGSNTLVAVQNIIEAVKLKYQNEGSNTHDREFHVFFNDHKSNDFNTLFRSLPIDKNYYASGVPGSFHGRLFPSASLHFVNSSMSLHWLSRLPEEIMDRNSPAWNKGRISYAKADDKVIEAYSKEYAIEMDSFLHARARELVPGGLMVITVVARPNGVPHSQVHANMLLEVLGSSLMELAKMGKIDEAKVDSCNIPLYLVSPKELDNIIRKNGSFVVEGMVNLPPIRSFTIEETSLSIKTTTGALISERFGHQILDELFDLHVRNLKKEPTFPLGARLNLFVLLKRKLHD